MRTSFHHQPEAQHPKSSAIHKLPADYPIFWGAAEAHSHVVSATLVEKDPKPTGDSGCGLARRARHNCKAGLG
jgi:hypothetical protein